MYEFRYKNINHIVMENPFEEKQIRRPNFLMVICILTFIGSGWSVLSGLFSLFTAGAMNSSFHMEHYSSMMNELGSEDMPVFFNSMLTSSMETLRVRMEHARELTVISLVLSVISLLGAILMFQLKRLGFYFYTAAQILALFPLAYFAGFTFAVVLGIFFSGIVSLIFIVLYALNLRYMH